MDLETETNHFCFTWKTVWKQLQKACHWVGSAITKMYNRSTKSHCIRLRHFMAHRKAIFMLAREREHRKKMLMLYMSVFCFLQQKASTQPKPYFIYLICIICIAISHKGLGATYKIENKSSMLVSIWGIWNCYCFKVIVVVFFKSLAKHNIGWERNDKSQLKCTVN